MVINSFPDEIILDILLRLPIKSLIRCTSVCKPWKSMIRSSQFIHTHLNRTIKATNQQGTHLLLHHGCYKNPSEMDKTEEVYSLHYDNHAFDEYCKIDFQIDSMVRKCNYRFRVAGVCNGVICLADDILSKFFNYILWNPSIRKAVMLPWPDVTLTSHGPFDDTIGFGFDALTGDYKVVRLVTLDHCSPNGDKCSAEPTLAEVYSLATGSWRSLGSIASCCDISSEITYVLFNGAIHWAVRRWDDGCSFILTFDVGSESFGEIMMPESIRSHQFLLSGSKVSVSGDGKSLALFTSSRKDYSDDPLLDIWVMKEYGVQESWTKLMTRGPQRIPRPLGFRKSGEVFLLLQYSFDETVLAWLDLASGKINRLESRRNNYCNSVHSYEESLVLLDVSNAVSC